MPEKFIDRVVLGIQEVYHGTFGDFVEFDSARLGSNTKAASAREGFFFASNKQVALSYASVTRRDLDINLELKKVAVGQAEDLTGDPHQVAASKFTRQSLFNTNFYSAEVLSKLGLILDRIHEHDEKIDRLSDIYFNDESKLADKGNLKSVFLDIKNPLVKDYHSSPFREEKFVDVIRTAKKLGHDSVVFKNTFDGGDPLGALELTNVYVVFNSNQILSDRKRINNLVKDLKPKTNARGKGLTI